VAVERKPMTAEELLRLSDDGMRHELLDGELRTMAPAGGPRGRAGGWAAGHLIRFIDDNGLGDVFMAETGFLLRRDPDHVRAPDFAFIRADRMPAEGLPRGFVPIPPDLVLEVVSPDDAASEIREKSRSGSTSAAGPSGCCTPDRGWTPTAPTARYVPTARTTTSTAVPCCRVSGSGFAT
jgi:Uma2 family endonuclease